MVIIDKRFESDIDLFLEIYEDRLDEMFDELDITIQEVLTILLRGGYITLPPYLRTINQEDSDNNE